MTWFAKSYMPWRDKPKSMKTHYPHVVWNHIHIQIILKVKCHKIKPPLLHLKLPWNWYIQVPKKHRKNKAKKGSQRRQGELGQSTRFAKCTKEMVPINQLILEESSISKGILNHTWAFNNYMCSTRAFIINYMQHRA